MQTRIGVIGGSGVCQNKGLEGASRVRLPALWGAASDGLLIGRLNGVAMAFLPRNGRGHVHTPRSIPCRADIDALKRAGCTGIPAVSAAGSRRGAIAGRVL